MIISDLNVLEAVEGSAIVGGMFTPGFTYKKDVKVNENTNLDFTSDSKVTDIFKKVATYNIDSKVKGNSSSFVFNNEAQGKNTNTQGTFNQLTVAGEYSGQYGTFVSAAS